MVEHLFTITLYKKLLDMVSRYALNQIDVEFERLNYAGIDSSHCGCVMRTTYGLPCACALAISVMGTIPFDTIHMFGHLFLLSAFCFHLFWRSTHRI